MNNENKYTTDKVAEITRYSKENIYRLRKKYSLGNQIGLRMWLFSEKDIDIIEENRKKEKFTIETRQKISEKNKAFRKTKKGREMMAKAWEKRRNNRRK